MRRLVTATWAALLLGGACTPHTTPDEPLVSSDAQRTGGPFEAAQAWVDTQWVAGATRDPALKSEAWQGAQIEGLWHEQGGWRALVLPTAGGAQGQAILLTIEATDTTYTVTQAQPAPADLLWPGM
jgi:hypothetical protein